MELPPRQRVPAFQICQRFNADGILQRVQRGELRQTTRLDKPLSPATCRAKGYPLGARKHILEYFAGETRLAVVHQVLLPDGSIGGSGLPDAKALLVAGGLWYV